MIIASLLTGFAYLTLLERRVLARIQVRIGPNRAGPLGLRSRWPTGPLDLQGRA
jgi:NADH-quinone oxidoreductase subunit H